jgi:hypothetical protein
LAYSLKPKQYDEAYLAEFGGKRKVTNKDKEAVEGIIAAFTKICPGLMELS